MKKTLYVMFTIYDDGEVDAAICGRDDEPSYDKSKMAIFAKSLRKRGSEYGPYEVDLDIPVVVALLSEARQTHHRLVPKCRKTQATVKGLVKEGE